MSWNFHVGQKVVCVDARSGAVPCKFALVKGEIYTISNLVPGRIDATLGLTNQVLAELEGFVEPHRYIRFGLWRFRPPVSDRGKATSEWVLKLKDDLRENKPIRITEDA